MTRKKEKKSETKICQKCGRELPLSSFNYMVKEQGTVMSICKECEHDKNQKKHEHKREIIQKLKSSGCCCCEEKDPNCLDFHHINQEEKEFNMSSALNKSDRKIIEESSKCVVVCANCHRKIHAGTLDITKFINMNQYRYMRKLIDLSLSVDNKEK
jgi:hypothetical protein